MASMLMDQPSNSPRSAYNASARATLSGASNLLDAIAAPCPAQEQCLLQHAIATETEPLHQPAEGGVLRVDQGVHPFRCSTCATNLGGHFLQL